jgi:1-acyl-sn-glycerol-3-phosphate acyltransferase
LNVVVDKQINRVTKHSNKTNTILLLIKTSLCFRAGGVFLFLHPAQSILLYMTDEEKIIDIKRLIKSKKPKVAKWIPGFVIRYLKRTLHENDVNKSLADNKGAKGIEFSDYVIEKFSMKVRVHGTENVPKTGGVILAMNHPLGGTDAMAMVTEFKHIRTDFKFVVNDILMNIENLKDIFVGVNKHGTNSKESLKLLNDLFASDQAVFVFPAGLVSRRKKGKVRDLDWKKTFITRARKFERNVIPVYIDGELSNFFYRLSNLRTKLGIKANIEMLYLVDELYQQENKELDIIFGEPIPYSTFTKEKKDLEWAQCVKNKVYELKK